MADTYGGSRGTIHCSDAHILISCAAGEKPGWEEFLRSAFNSFDVDPPRASQLVEILTDRGLVATGTAPFVFSGPAPAWERSEPALEDVSEPASKDASEPGPVKAPRKPRRKSE